MILLVVVIVGSTVVAAVAGGDAEVESLAAAEADAIETVGNSDADVRADVDAVANSVAGGVTVPDAGAVAVAAPDASALVVGNCVPVVLEVVVRDAAFVALAAADADVLGVADATEDVDTLLRGERVTDGLGESADEREGDADPETQPVAAADADGGAVPVTIAVEDTDTTSLDEPARDALTDCDAARDTLTPGLADDTPEAELIADAGADALDEGETAADADANDAVAAALSVTVKGEEGEPVDDVDSRAVALTSGVDVNSAEAEFDEVTLRDGGDDGDELCESALDGETRDDLETIALALNDAVALVLAVAAGDADIDGVADAHLDTAAEADDVTEYADERDTRGEIEGGEDAEGDIVPVIVALTSEVAETVAVVTLLADIEADAQAESRAVAVGAGVPDTNAEREGEPDVDALRHTDGVAVETTVPLTVTVPTADTDELTIADVDAAPVMLGADEREPLALTGALALADTDAVDDKLVLGDAVVVPLLERPGVREVVALSQPETDDVVVTEVDTESTGELDVVDESVCVIVVSAVDDVVSESGPLGDDDAVVDEEPDEPREADPDADTLSNAVALIEKDEAGVSVLTGVAVVDAAAERVTRCVTVTPPLLETESVALVHAVAAGVLDVHADAAADAVGCATVAVTGGVELGDARLLGVPAADALVVNVVLPDSETVIDEKGDWLAIAE